MTRLPVCSAQNATACPPNRTATRETMHSTCGRAMQRNWPPEWQRSRQAESGRQQPDKAVQTGRSSRRPSAGVLEWPPWSANRHHLDRRDGMSCPIASCSYEPDPVVSTSDLSRTRKGDRLCQTFSQTVFGRQFQAARVPLIPRGRQAWDWFAGNGYVSQTSD